MIRSILAVIVGVFAWFVAATILNLVVREVIPGYSAAEESMTFSLAMMICRLVVGLGSSLASGFLTKFIARDMFAPAILAGLMVIMFVPIHYMLWDKFPVWYHLFFLITLGPAILLGSKLARRQ